ncbi:MAG: hypothetical protein K0Q58_832 [Microbacterium sp.]|jgi:hypothetical protein|nr:hypothetical protein [Microbacterium sp.]
MSEANDRTRDTHGADDIGAEPDDARVAALEADGVLDGLPSTPDVREEQELRAEVERELRFDGFEQGIQG